MENGWRNEGESGERFRSLPVSANVMITDQDAVLGVSDSHGRWTRSLIRTFVWMTISFSSDLQQGIRPDMVLDDWVVVAHRCLLLHHEDQCRS